jgi:hypothetical protein
MKKKEKRNPNKPSYLKCKKKLIQAARVKEICQATP